MCNVYLLNVVVNSIVVCISEKYANKPSFSSFNNKKLQRIWRIAFVACIIFTAFCSYKIGLWGYGTVNNDVAKASITAAICSLFTFAFLCITSYGIGKVIKWTIE